MQVQFITCGKKYNRTSISKNSFTAYLEDNQFIVMRSEYELKHSHVQITNGITRLKSGDKEWIINSHTYQSHQPKYLIAQVKEVC